MDEIGAERLDNLPSPISTGENERADTLSDACQEGNADGDGPACPSVDPKPAELPEFSQEAPLWTVRW